MNKILNKISIPVIAVMLFITSCSKDFTDRNPLGSINTGEAITTELALQNALNGAYAGMRSVAVYGRDFPVIGDVQADNGFIEAVNSGRYLPQYQYNFTVTDGTYTEIWN
ncbi:MAG TPA: hypothetical protein VGI61_06465, partial [Parafilimonas sp.]